MLLFFLFFLSYHWSHPQSCHLVSSISWALMKKSSSKAQQAISSKEEGKMKWRPKMKWCRASLKPHKAAFCEMIIQRWIFQKDTLTGKLLKQNWQSLGLVFCVTLSRGRAAGNLVFLKAGNNRREEIHWQRLSQVQIHTPAFEKVTAAFNRQMSRSVTTFWGLIWARAFLIPSPEKTAS